MRHHPPNRLGGPDYKCVDYSYHDLPRFSLLGVSRVDAAHIPTVCAPSHRRPRVAQKYHAVQRLPRSPSTAFRPSYDPTRSGKSGELALSSSFSTTRIHAGDVRNTRDAVPRPYPTRVVGSAPLDVRKQHPRRLELPPLPSRPFTRVIPTARDDAGGPMRHFLDKEGPPSSVVIPKRDW